jgi:site-specific DNA-methyltransferase (adenine-specific)/adenine-specific DNA-methyltransferase
MDRGAYLAWMTDRLEATRALLAPNGSLFLHVDPRVSHYLKVALDGVFGEKGFVNEIIWRYRSGGRATRRYAAKHDVILWYANGPDWVFHPDVVAVASERRNHMRRSKDAAGNPVRLIRSNGRVYRYAENARVPPCDVWDDISHLNQRDPERSGYPTQKPLALLERIIAGSTNPGDLVLDPFCGSGTALVAARRLGRRGLGIDSSPVAVEICQRRLDDG